MAAKKRFFLFFFIFVFVEVFLLLGIGFSFIPFASSGSGDNVTVNGTLNVSESYPTILNISIDSGAETITLIPNSTKKVYCVGRVVDFNSDDSIDSAIGYLYDDSVATISSLDDNNNHYTNSSCEIITDFTNWNGYEDDEYHALVNCSFDLEYYSNPSVWHCALNVSDNVSLTDEVDGDTINVSELLAIGLPDYVNYGEVNATYVSNEVVLDVENMGNVQTDMRVSAYAQTPGDNLAMSCSLGLNKTILIDNEKYNISSSNSGALSFTEFESVYKSASSVDVLEEINLNYRQDDILSDAINPTYWRIYVPRGVAGTCSGNIVFSAVRGQLK